MENKYPTDEEFQSMYQTCRMYLVNPDDLTFEYQIGEQTIVLPDSIIKSDGN